MKLAEYYKELWFSFFNKRNITLITIK